ncbi:M20/M25/M40 family metallo-hydrolase [candidate division KSB1 bacterium]|nr:M20/M25/M40 family metallo-hydrolase [candidate division KSB1 bacterium]
MIELLNKLIGIPSVTGDEYHIGQFLEELLKNKGYTVKTQAVDQNRFNIIALTDNDPFVLFNTHIDTVPPFIPPGRDGNRIYGRGACDAKGQIVTIIDAADRLLKENIKSFGLLFVVGEEVESDGAKKAARLNLNSRYLVICEPTENKLVVGQKGTIVFRVKAKGSGGHSCNPEKGESAIHKIISYLSKWQDYDWGTDPFFGQSTVNIGKISGGSGINILAEYAEAEGIFRVTTFVKQLKQKMEQLNNKLVDIEILSESDPQRLFKLDGFETTIVGFGTDASYLKPLGDILVLGPGSIEFAHCDNEHIVIEDLKTGSDLLVKIVKQLIKGNE